MTTIYYMSATGNSLQAAKHIRERLERDGQEVWLVPMDTALRTGELRPEGDVGLVMPLHFFGVPLLAEAFLAQLELAQAGYVFAVLTSGWHYMSSAVQELTELVAARRGQLAAAFYVDLVSVYLPLGPIPPAAKLAAKLGRGGQRLAAVAEKIAARRPEKDSEYLSWLSRRIHSHVRAGRQKLDKDFTVSDACIHCGLCEQICPVENIRLTEGHPAWQHHCTQCLACLHVCPQQAIDFGTKTRGLQRYRHPEVTVPELLRKQ